MNKGLGDAKIFLSVYKRITDENTRIAFFHLVTSLANETALHWQPYRHGRQSAVHLLFDREGKTTGNLANGAQFAFGAAQGHLYWWFREPCMNFDLLSRKEISGAFELRQSRQDPEVALRLYDIADIDRLTPLLVLAQNRYVRATHA